MSNSRFKQPNLKPHLSVKYCNTLSIYDITEFSRRGVLQYDILNFIGAVFYMTQELYGADCSRANACIKLQVSGNHFRSYKLFKDLKSGSLWCEKKRFRGSIKGVMTRSMVDASRSCIPHS